MKILPDRGLAVSAGILAAVFSLEGVLRVFATAGPPPVPHAGRDSFDAPVVVSRQIDEGIASARFSRAGARLTGNAPIPDAPVTVFLGDSYVVAREVADDQTMGSRVESLARLERVDINVRQYGWRGASAGQYLQAAQEVMQRWNPDHVVIVLSEDDLGADALNRNFPRLAIGPNDQVSLVHSPGENGEDVYSPSASVLGELFRARWQRVLLRSPAAVQRLGGARHELRGPVPDSASIAAVPRATVKALGRAFGPSLVIVYVADVRVNSGHQSEIGETELLRSCAEMGVRCASTRAAMVTARSRGVIARGFSSTTLGVGHLNPAGHQLVADEIWKLLRLESTAGATTQIAER